MLERIRVVLRTQYIGAIVIGILWAVGVRALISCVAGTVQWLMNVPKPSVLTGWESPRFDWSLIVVPWINAILHLGIGWVILRWSYLAPGVPLPEAQQDAELANGDTL